MVILQLNIHLIIQIIPGFLFPTDGGFENTYFVRKAKQTDVLSVQYFEIAHHCPHLDK